MSRGKLKLTDEIFALIPALIEEGRTKAEIAATYGVKTSTLIVQCSRRGVSLRKGGRRGPRVTLSLPTPAPAPYPTPLPLSAKAMLALHAAAKARGKCEARLACELLEIIAKDDLYVAVLGSIEESTAA